jgi:hypothetical protein
VGDGQLVYAGAPIKDKDQVIGAVVAAYYVAGSVARQSSQVADAFREYRHRQNSQTAHQE